MKRSALVIMMALGMSSAAAFAADVALVTAVKGDVKMQPAGKPAWRKAAPMQGLAAGSKLRVGAGGQATVVLFGNGARCMLLPGSTVAVAAGSCQSLSGPAPKALAALAVRQQKILQGSLLAGLRTGAVTTRGGSKQALVLQSLVDTAVMDDHPVFKWQAVPGATSYKLKLKDEDDQIIWQPEVNTNSVTYAADAPALKPGVDYTWTVTSTVGDVRWAPEKDGIFRVLAADKRQAVKDELAGLDGMDDEDMANLLRAEVYYRNGLTDDALPLYQALLAKSPDSTSVRTALAQILADQGRTRESQQLLDEAKKLSAESENSDKT